MHRMLVRVFAVLAVVAAGLASAQAQEWALNPEASHFYMQTAKAELIIETHQFTGISGNINRDGDATVKIDLTSVKSGVDVRDVRMRYLLFETFKFPDAEVRAHLEMSRLQELQSKTRITYPLKFTLSMHGITKDFETPVFVTRVTDKTVSVATAKPIIITAESFGLAAGISKLSEAVSGTPIVSAASFTFDLVFETGDRIAVVETELQEAARRKHQEETRTISVEECETRFGVISTAGEIFFKTGSAELDRQSDPMLDSVAEIANRCPAARIEVTGHTDSVGSRESNMALSVERARSVLSFLVQRGVRPTRITASGYGETRPVASNETEYGRAKNRRIEFRVVP